MSKEIPIRCFSISLFVLCNCAAGWRVLLLKRSGKMLNGQWCQIAGGIEHGETAWQTALREAREETGLQLSELYSADCCEQFYEAHRDAITVAPVFVAYVDGSCEITLNHEHSEYRWVSFADAHELLTFPGQRKTLDWIKTHFADNAPSPLLKMPTTP